MNIERLEMMRVMMERVVAGSWHPTVNPKALHHELSDMFDVGIGNITKVDAVNLHHWVKPTQNNCGFTACAVGHACFDAEFGKLGLRWSGSAPMFNSKFGWGAIEQFFDISPTIAEKLFHVNRYTKIDYLLVDHLPKNVQQAKLVALRIQLLLDTGVL